MSETDEARASSGLKPEEARVRSALALARVPGIGPILFARLAAKFGSAEAALRAPRTALETVEGVGSKGAAAVAGFRDWGSVDREMQALGIEGIEVLVYGEPGYPELLAQTEGAPPVIYVRGALGPDDSKAVAVVGTRNPDNYGRRVARDLAGGLAAKGVTVVSGFARGVDQEAHGAALDAGGRTLAVLGCGLDADYPRGSGALRDRVVARGALLTEFPLGTGPLPDHFRRRNRIISGLAWGLVLVQGSKRSGALITVRNALEQGRQVFCVPGSIYSERSEAPHLFLKQGATPVETVEDVFEVLAGELERAPRGGAEAEAESGQGISGGEKKLPEGLSTEEKAILAALEATDALHRDELLARAGLDATRAAPILLRLELQGHLKAQPGGHYIRS